MTRARRGRRAGLLVAVTAALLSGCGGGDGDAARDRADAARAYAGRVAAVTETTRRELTATSDDADYRDAVAAETTTRSYASTIRSAADELSRQTPPAAVAAQHRELIALYRTSADHLDAIAARFASAQGSRVLAAVAQDLSAEVQTLSTREASLRTAIDQALAQAVPTTPAAG